MATWLIWKSIDSWCYEKNILLSIRQGQHGLSRKDLFRVSSPINIVLNFQLPSLQIKPKVVIHDRSRRQPGLLQKWSQENNHIHTYNHLPIFCTWMEYEAFERSLASSRLQLSRPVIGFRPISLTLSFQRFSMDYNSNSSMVTLVKTAGLLSPGVTLLKGYKKRFALCKKRLLLNLGCKKIHNRLGQLRSGQSGINLDKHFNTNWDIWSFDRGTWLLFIRYWCFSANIET